MIVGKIDTKNENTFKGISINRFDKIISKKYNTQNYNIPMSSTDRIRPSNVNATSIANNTYTKLNIKI